MENYSSSDHSPTISYSSRPNSVDMALSTEDNHVYSDVQNPLPPIRIKKVTELYIYIEYII